MNSKVKEIEQATLRKEKLEFNVGDSVKAKKKEYKFMKG